MRCGIPASSHVAEVEQVAEGGDDRVEEEAQPQKQQELVSPRLQRWKYKPSDVAVWHNQYHLIHT